LTVTGRRRRRRRVLLDCMQGAADWLSDVMLY
jgi:hypothetical protein